MYPYLNWCHTLRCPFLGFLKLENKDRPRVYMIDPIMLVVTSVVLCYDFSDLSQHFHHFFHVHIPHRPPCALRCSSTHSSTPLRLFQLIFVLLHIFLLLLFLAFPSFLLLIGLLLDVHHHLRHVILVIFIAFPFYVRTSSILLPIHRHRPVFLLVRFVSFLPSSKWFSFFILHHHHIRVLFFVPVLHVFVCLSIALLLVLSRSYDLMGVLFLVHQQQHHHGLVLFFILRLPGSSRVTWRFYCR